MESHGALYLKSSHTEAINVPKRQQSTYLSHPQASPRKKCQFSFKDISTKSNVCRSVSPSQVSSGKAMCAMRAIFHSLGARSFQHQKLVGLVPSVGTFASSSSFFSTAELLSPLQLQKFQIPVVWIIMAASSGSSAAGMLLPEGSSGGSQPFIPYLCRTRILATFQQRKPQERILNFSI